VKTRGFSLVELLIVLGIMTLVTSIGMISLRSFQEKSNAHVLISEVLRAIQLARSTAIARNEMVMLCPRGSHWQNGFVIKTQEQVLYGWQNLTIQGELHWRAFPLGRQEIDFLPTGFPRHENGTFWFCKSVTAQPAWAVVMNRSGRIRTVYPDKQGNVLDSKGIPLRC
jgi:type IV fimbrial biogenesis protein FimT